MVILIRSNPLYTMHVCNMCRNHMYINVMQVYIGQGQSLRRFIANWVLRELYQCNTKNIGQGQ